MAYHGITLIPPESLTLFEEIVLSNKAIKRFDEVGLLYEKIQEAKTLNKYMIHYGI